MDPEIAKLIKEAQVQVEKKLNWINTWKQKIADMPDLAKELWLEKKLIQKLPLPRTISIYDKIAAVDGGIIQEELRAFDIVIYRAIATIFSGIGKQVHVDYFPNFEPVTKLAINKSFQNNHEFAKYCGMLRINEEYKIARATIEEHSPQVLFLDGPVYPRPVDLNLNGIQNPLLIELQKKIKDEYNKLVASSKKFQVVIIGIVKDSRSRYFTKKLVETLNLGLKSKKIKLNNIRGFEKALQGILDIELTSAILNEGARTAWLSIPRPDYLLSESESDFWISLIKPLKTDSPVRIELLRLKNCEWFEKSLKSALESFYILCQHGLQLNLPTILLEADKRVKLSKSHLDEVLNHFSIEFNLPLEKLKKKRSFLSSLEKF